MQNEIKNNIVILEPSKNLRTLGRNALSGNWKIAILAVLVYELIINVVPAVLNTLFGINISEIYYNTGYQGDMNAEWYSLAYSSMPKYCPISGIYLLLVTGPLSLGLILFFLAMFRRQLVEVSDIFLGFEKFGKAVGLAVFQGIFIFLWTLLFIVPGIIAAIRYSQAFFILADDPEKGIRQCMNESKAMMKGNKGKYFLLSLSFIGWMILAIVPAVVINGVIDAMALNNYIVAIGNIVGDLFMIPVLAYMLSTFAGFYEIAAGHLIKATEPAPIEEA